ncbi:unnamed protein product [Arabidopsis lyrata]|uniref:Predicted protein n=1 Tax=Arabidopsis lyrata subsp. lyrata TaxID=81972 RepID=D7KSP9_ARALL|nr:predicted protein [Arabidopsis lyrata subsp. lyrata]CAH8258256.1 unnamed protein product [Arabidopsis lyrata]
MKLKITYTRRHGSIYGQPEKPPPATIPEHEATRTISHEIEKILVDQTAASIQHGEPHLRGGKTSSPTHAISLKTVEPLSQGEKTNKPPERPRTACLTNCHKNQNSKSKTEQPNLSPIANPISDQQCRPQATIETGECEEAKEKRRGNVGEEAEIALAKHQKNYTPSPCHSLKTRKKLEEEAGETPPDRRGKPRSRQKTRGNQIAASGDTEPPSARPEKQTTVRRARKHLCRLKEPPNQNADTRAPREEKPQPWNHH